MNSTQQQASVWSVGHIVCPLKARTASEAIDELAATVGGDPAVLDLDGLVRAIRAREGVAPTYLGGGVAMPHARTPAVDRLTVAVGLSPTGLDWGTARERARLIFLVGVPRDEDGSYLHMVRRITQVVRHLDWIEQAVACGDAGSLARLLRTSIPL